MGVGISLVAGISLLFGFRLLSATSSAFRVFRYQLEIETERTTLCPRKPVSPMNTASPTAPHQKYLKRLIGSYMDSDYRQTEKPGNADHKYCPMGSHQCATIASFGDTETPGPIIPELRNRTWSVQPVGREQS